MTTDERIRRRVEKRRGLGGEERRVLGGEERRGEGK